MKSLHENSLTFAGVEPGIGLKLAVGMPRASLIRVISDSGLRGRGGAGFPAGTKWNLAAAASGTDKFVVCNADEGEPGTFKDRVILHDFAGLVFEGMTICAYATGAKYGILYLRGEYTYLRDALSAEIERLRSAGLLGTNILGKEGFDFDVEIRMGAGAYVCGEETALIESLEGHRGEARNRPPFPVNTGYHGRPTVVNNVETLAWAACILANGPEWFKSLGTPESPGLKLFSVSGDCKRPGVYEYPLGILIRTLLTEVGGENAKAAIVGGASGVCIPRKDFGRKIAFEDVSTGGSVIVLGQLREMLAVAENFLEFFCEESCGQCTPCRSGNPVMLDAVRRLRAGKLNSSELKDVCALGGTMRIASKCGLGQSSPNVFLSILEHFGGEIPVERT